MSGYGDLLDLIPVDKLAGRLGMDEQSVAQALDAAIPALVSGLQANAQNPSGAASLEKALAQHNLPDDGVNVDDIDTEDGAKIVQHVFGGNQDAVAAQLGGTAGGGIDTGTIVKLLPLLAPVIMGFLSKKMNSSSTSSTTAKETAAAPKEKAQPKQQKQAESGGGITDILGGLLGGGSGGGITDILGGLLGGKR